uniref:CSD_1 domain-containing protein n=1 Tax=Caenorhabditis tropicalis TaxID=1561998 RepID=A0A1I7THP0_9PELO
MSDAANVSIAEEALEKKLGELSTNDKAPSSDGEEKMRKHRLPTAERIRMWEEEQKAKPVLTTGLQGKVKWYSVLRRYGFISRNDGEKDVFVHQTAISKSNTEKFYLRTLGDEEEVLFDLVKGKNGPEAANVTGPEGANVVGSRYRHKLLSRFRTNRKPRHSVDGDVSEQKADSQPKDSTATAEDKKKPKKQRKNRTRKPKAELKGNGDAADSSAVTDSTDSNSAAGSPDSKSCSKIIDEEATLSKIDRCGSAMGDAGLGAQPIDAQI